MADDSKQKSLDARNKIKALISDGSSFLERDEALRAILLAFAAGESVFLYGPPGTAKSLLATWTSMISGDECAFSCLMNQYTQPDELFGPVSIEKLGEGVREVLTQGYLPSVRVAFLDEIFKAGPAILNTLLTIINERTFRNGTQTESVPLKILLGASNELPDDDAGLEALYDRFLIRVEVRPVKKRESFARLLEGKAGLPPRPKNPITDEELTAWKDGASEILVSEALSAFLFSLKLRLDERGIYVSDRRWAKAGGILRVSAFLNGRTVVSLCDALVLGNVLWTRPDELADIAECTRASISEEAVFESFSKAQELREALKVLSEKKCQSDEAFDEFSKELDEFLKSVRSFEEAAKEARVGGEDFWENVFCTLNTPFERTLMALCVDILLDFLEGATHEAEKLRFSRRPKVQAVLDSATPTVILRAADEAINSALKTDEAKNQKDESAAQEPDAKKTRLAAFGSAIRGFFPSAQKSNAEDEANSFETPDDVPEIKSEELDSEIAETEESSEPLEKNETAGDWSNPLSQIRSFGEFVQLSGFEFRGDSGDDRYRWNGNRNNGEAWWNVGSRFNRFLEDRASVEKIELECSKRGAGVGGKYHWVYAVCYIFEKNDGKFDERTCQELEWLSGSAWPILQDALKEALS